MQTFIRLCIRYTSFVCFALVFFCTEIQSAEPTLARVSFWVPSDRQAEFATAFDQGMLPILKKYGLAESEEQGRSTVEGSVTRLFEAASPAQVLRIRSALRRDSDWVSE